MSDGRDNEETESKISMSQVTTSAQAEGRWTNEEHNLFVEALKQHGKNWSLVAQVV